MIRKITAEGLNHSNFPKILYKYRTWESEDHKNVLVNSELFFAPHKSFGNDSEEFDFEYDLDLISDKDLYEFYFNNPEFLFESFTHRNLNALEMTRNSPFKDLKHVKQKNEDTMTFLNEIYGVLCLTSSFDNAQLWRDFANDFSGYCVGIDKEFMFKNGVINVIAGWVNYYRSSQKPKLLPPLTEDSQMNNMFTRIFNLPERFKSEKEFRLAKSILNSSRYYHVNPAHFLEIILGFNMDKVHKEEIIEIRNEKFPNTKIIEQVYDHEKITYKTCDWLKN